MTDASVHHDSCLFVGLLTAKDRVVSVDSAYVGEWFRVAVNERFPWVRLQVCSRVFRNAPLMVEDKVRNRLVACVRCRVEHVFGYISFYGWFNV
ncbi:MAG: hypothetical protein LBE76_03790 [Nitrososphaerota archaeon]|nr:hypothetical protein [Nitrososphaerota archaeon]